MNDKLSRLASETRLLVVADGVPSDRVPGDGDDWKSLLGGLACTAGTTVVSIAPVSGFLVEVTVQRDGTRFHSFATSPEAQALLNQLRDQLDQAIIYIGDGTHSASLETHLTSRDLIVTNHRPCNHADTVSLTELDQARPIVELMYVLRSRDQSTHRPSGHIGRHASTTTVAPVSKRPFVTSDLGR